MFHSFEKWGGQSRAEKNVISHASDGIIDVKSKTFFSFSSHIDPVELEIGTWVTGPSFRSCTFDSVTVIEGRAIYPTLLMFILFYAR